MSISDPPEVILKLHNKGIHELSITNCGAGVLWSKSDMVIRLLRDIFKHLVTFENKEVVWEINVEDDKTTFEWLEVKEGEEDRTIFHLEVIPFFNNDLPATYIRIKDPLPEDEELVNYLRIIVFSALSASIMTTVGINKTIQDSNVMPYSLDQFDLKKTDKVFLYKKLILDYMSEGSTQREIADKLPISYKTVTTYIAQMKNEGYDLDYARKVGSMRKKNKNLIVT